MDILLLALAIVCVIVGMVGAVLPMLPGPPLSYAALWLMWWRDPSEVSSTALWITGVLMVVLLVADYLAPIWLTKKGGGSRQAERGATVGLIIGLFFGLWGLLLGPFLGALVGELMAKSPLRKALKVASLSFIAFLQTTGLKLLYGIALAVMVAMAI